MSTFSADSWASCSHLVLHIARQCGLVMFSVASVCLSVCNALTFESLDPESSILVYVYIFRIFRSSSYIKVIGSRSRSRSQGQQAYLCLLFGDGLPSIETPSCCTVVACLIVFCLRRISWYSVNLHRNILSVFPYSCDNQIQCKTSFANCKWHVLCLKSLKQQLVWALK